MKGVTPAAEFKERIQKNKKMCEDNREKELAWIMFCLVNEKT